MSDQPEALRLADALESDYYDDVRVTAAAAELRRLRAERDALRAACSIVADRLQMDIDDGSRPDQWSMQDMVRTLDAARAALEEAKE